MYVFKKFAKHNFKQSRVENGREKLAKKIVKLKLVNGCLSNLVIFGAYANSTLREIYLNFSFFLGEILL